MSSVDHEKAAPSAEAPAAAAAKKVAAPKAEAPPSEAPPARYFAVADVILRVLLFASTLTAVVVMVTSKQTESVSIPVSPFVARIPAKFNHSPSFIYFVAAQSVAGLYSIISSVLSFLVLLKPAYSTKLLFHLVIFDALLLGIIAAATGASGGVAYIGLKGNSHTKWQKVCNVYDEFCRHLAASIAVSLFASIVLLLLVLLSVYTLYKKIPK